jgi:hypothetical protein
MRQRALRTAFVVGIQELRRADEILASAGPRRYTVLLSDGRELTAPSLDALTGITNLKSRHIRRIEVTTPWREILRASLTLRRDRKLASLEYDLIGEERSVVQVARELDAWMHGVRVWYSRLATVDWVVLLIGTWLSVLLAIGLVVVLLAQAGRLSLSPVPGFGDAIAAAMWTIPLLLGTVVNFFRNGLFPIGTYLIFDGVKRHERAIRARQILGGGFLLSMLASMIATVVASVV